MTIARPRSLLFALSFLLLTSSAAANPFQYQWEELAPGVWAGIRVDPFELPQEGNTVFVTTSEGVIVFDAGGSPLMGDAIVAKARSVTDKPITHVILSHWHGDHMRGLQSIVAAYPKVTILAHPFARELISASQGKWLKRRVSMVPNIRKALTAALSNEKDLSGRALIADEKAWLQQGLGIADQLDRENNRTTFVVPNATFTERLTLHLGGREIQFLHDGRAHTAGDIVMWLPHEKIVATGDIVTAPVPLMSNPYTNEYPGVLENIRALGFTTLVPGHGVVQHDASYIELLLDTLRTVSTQMKSLVAKGVPKDEAIAAIDYAAVEPRFTHGDAFLANRFDDYVRRGLAQAAYLVESGGGITENF